MLDQAGEHGKPGAFEVFAATRERPGLVNVEADDRVPFTIAGTEIDAYCADSAIKGRFRKTSNGGAERVDRLMGG